MILLKILGVTFIIIVLLCVIYLAILIVNYYRYSKDIYLYLQHIVKGVFNTQLSRDLLYTECYIDFEKKLVKTSLQSKGPIYKEQIRYCIKRYTYTNEYETLSCNTEQEYSLLPNLKKIDKDICRFVPYFDSYEEAVQFIRNYRYELIKKLRKENALKKLIIKKRNTW